MERPLGPLRIPPHAGHSGGPGGVEPPPPALPQMIYICSLEVTEHEGLGHVDVHRGGGAETQ